MGERLPLLFVLVGPVGCGKSHLAARISAVTGCAVVSNDRIRAQLAVKPSFADEENRMVYRTALTAIERQLVGGMDVVYDGTNLDDDLRERVRQIAEPLADVLFIVTCAGDAVCHARLAGRPGGAEQWWPIYQQLAERMHPIKSSFFLVNTAASTDGLTRLLRRLV